VPKRRHPTPRRPLNPALLRRVEQSGKSITGLALAAGFPHYPQFYVVLREEKVIATPLLVDRLTRLARVLGFPPDQIFLDEHLEVRR
jgi:hypothetical protein